MALPPDMEIVKVILPKTYLPKIDALIAAGQRSRSAVIRRMVEEVLDINFFAPDRSVNGSNISNAEHPAEPVEA